MTTRKTITGDLNSILQQINEDFQAGNISSDYHVLLKVNQHNIEFDTVSSPGGGEEGGYSITTFSASLLAGTDFRFAVHPEDFVNRIGKFFGGQDVVLGFPEFDKHVIVKTNDAEKVKSVFNNPALREALQNLSGFSLNLAEDNEKEGLRLELTIQRLVNNVELPKLFNAFTYVLGLLDEVKDVE